MDQAMCLDSWKSSLSIGTSRRQRQKLKQLHAENHLKGFLAKKALVLQEIEDKFNIRQGDGQYICDMV